MTNKDFNWRAFLDEWNEVLICDKNIRKKLSQEVFDLQSLGYLGASEEDICFAEDRLSINLPPSYRDFLKTSNGWQYMSYFIDRLFPANEINWLRIIYPEWAAAWANEDEDYIVDDDEYFSYRQDGPAEGDMRVEYISSCLAISAVGDGALLLLNPKIIFEDGEWEAWFLAAWQPEAGRYRSFLHLMKDMYRQFLLLKDL